MTVGVFNRCVEEANKSNYEVRLGAVIFKGSKIISSGHNYIRSCSSVHSRYRKWMNSLHAEVDAIINAGDVSKLKGASILVMKVSKKYGKLSNGNPCPWCKLLIKNSGIKTIYYSNKFGEIESIKVNNIELSKEDFVIVDNFTL